MPTGGHELYVYRDSLTNFPDSFPLSVYPTNVEMFHAGIGLNVVMSARNSFHWNANQYLHIGASALTNFFNLTTNDVRYAHLKHWNHDHSDDGAYDKGDVSSSLCMERLPSADGTTDGQTIWYAYYADSDQHNSSGGFQGYRYVPNCVAKVLPDASTNFVWGQYNEWGLFTNLVSSFSVAGNQYSKTNVFVFGTNGIDLL